MTVTVLHSSGANFRKTFSYAGAALKSCSADFRAYFVAESFEVADLDGLSTLLHKLENDPARFLIRGHVIDGVDLTQRLRRRIADGLSSPQEAPFKDLPISWLMIDVDKYPIPKNIDLLTQTLQAVEHIVQQLPKQFGECSYHYQLSGSAGVNYTDRISVHLVFWLDRPATSSQLKTWAKAVNSDNKLIDDSLYNPVQPHYTAKPSFPVGFEDPFEGRRSGLIKKSKPCVSIDFSVVETVTQQRKTVPQKNFEGVSGYANILNELGDGIGGQGFHSPLLRGVASHVSVNGREKAEATRESLKDDLRTRIDAADSSNHTYEDIERYKTDAVLDGLIDSAIAKYGDEKSCPAHFDVVEQSIEEAEAKLDKTIDDFSRRFHHYWKAGLDDFEDPPCIAIKATAGLGKTSKLIARLIRHNALELGDIHYFVPTHKLSQQLLSDLDEALDVDVKSFVLRKTQLIAGRDKTDENGSPLCEKAALAKEVAKLGLPVSTTLCKSSSNVCQFYDSCGYQKQFGDKEAEAAAEANNPRFNEVFSDVKVMAHNHLFLNTKGRMRKPKLVIIDEAFWQTGLDEQRIAPIDLMTVGKPIAAFIFATLLNPESAPLLKALREAGYGADSLKAEADEIEEAAAVKVDIKPAMTTSEQTRKLEASAYVVKTHTLLRHLAAEMTKVERDNSHVVRYEPQSNDKNPKAGQLVMTTRKHLNVDSTTPIIFIDANAQKEILEQFVESVDVVEIAAQRKATIHQFTDRSFSKQSLFANEGQLMEQAKVFVAGVASKGSTLVACTKTVKVAICGNGDTYAGATFVNFGNLRGLNNYSGFENIIILGREQPSANAVSDKARAMWWGSEEPLRALQDKGGNQPYASQPRGYRGIQRGSVQVQVHPDWRAQLLLEQIREAESEQALDRLRLLRGEGTQRQVYILSNVPLNVTVDFGWSWSEYQQLLSLWDESDGLMPLNPEHLMERCPNNAKKLTRTKELIQAWKRSEILISNTISKSDLLVQYYRPVGSSSRWSSFVTHSTSTADGVKLLLGSIISGKVEIRNQI